MLFQLKLMERMTCWVNLLDKNKSLTLFKNLRYVRMATVSRFQLAPTIEIPSAMPCAWCRTRPYRRASHLSISARMPGCLSMSHAMISSARIFILSSLSNLYKKLRECQELVFTRSRCVRRLRSRRKASSISLGDCFLSSSKYCSSISAWEGGATCTLLW